MLALQLREEQVPGQGGGDRQEGPQATGLTSQRWAPAPAGLSGQRGCNSSICQHTSDRRGIWGCSRGYPWVLWPEAPSSTRIVCYATVLLGARENEATEGWAPTCHPSLPRPTLPYPLVSFHSTDADLNCHTAELIYSSCGLALAGVEEQHVITLCKFYNSTEN